MADDIDIEEHDVLDNPRLKNIFPNITSIMSAVDYDDEENVDYEEKFDNIFTRKIKIEPIDYDYDNKEIFNTHKNVIIFGSKPSTPQPNSIKSLDEPQKQHPLDIDCEDEPEILPCSVVLEDWQVFLTNNPCYCPICQILFPTVNEYDFHRVNTHSFLVAVSNNKAVKSTSKISNIEYKPIKEDINKIDLLCKHCNEYYPDEIALIKHKYSLIPQTYSFIQEETKDEPLKSNQMVQSNEELYLMCKICSCFFKTEVFYRTHVNICHGDPEMDIIKAPFDGKCKHCTKTLLIPKSYNWHVRVFHMDQFYIKHEGKKQGNFRCHLCNKAFSSAKSELVHRATQHKRSLKATNTLKPYKNRDKGLASKFNVKSNALKSNTLRSNTLKNNIASKNIQLQALIQKSHLFKCNKCQIYFTSSFGAIEHSRHCVLKKGDFKCQTCRHPFKLSERSVHNQQHALNSGGRFKTVVITDEVLPLLLNRCKICSTCFDPRTFKLEHASGCRPSKCVECSTCHLLIHKSSISDHLKYHRELNLTVKDFIITNYFPIDKPIKQVESTSTLALPYKPYKRKLALSRGTLLHCPSCKCNVRLKKKTDGHTTGQCKKRDNRQCKFCGLRFTTKGLESHIQSYKNTHKVTDFVFINILNGKKIVPPLPEFPACSTCHVHFFNNTELRCHNCGTEKHKSCKLCNIKLSSSTIKIHSEFHQYKNSYQPTASVANRRPIAVTAPKTTTSLTKNLGVAETNKPIFDLMKKYESLVSIWNILYRCQLCDVFLDSYDSVVEHCQDHFSYMENYNVDISYCKKCKLKFFNTSYNRHQRLHLDNDINVKTFTIIDYDYSKLLSDDWFKIFDQLSKDQIRLILSKSIYNEIKEVRLHLQSDGSLGSIYKCLQCNHSVDAQSVIEHVRDDEEFKTAGFEHSCAICDVGFSDKNTAIAHEISHQSSDERFRIISFNGPKDKFIDKALITNIKANDLIFVRCQFCSKLINKSLYKNHMIQHAQSVDNTNGKKGVFHYHVCRKCEVAVSHKTVPKHVCSNERQKRRCPKCLLHIRTTYMMRHNMTHNMYPNMLPENIKVTYFNNKERASTRKVRFYQCSSCQVCVLSNIKSHNCVSNKIHAKCKECGINVHASHRAAHKMMHKKNQFNSKNITIVKFVKPSVRIGKLFRCPICNLHFNGRKSVAWHLAHSDHNRKQIMCKKCKVPFGPNTFTRHLKLHNVFKSFDVMDYYGKDGHPTQKLCDVPNTSTETKVSKTKQIARTSNVSNRTTHPTQKLCDVPNTSTETKVSKTKQIARTSNVSNRTTHPTQKLCDVPNTSTETKVSKTKQIARTSNVSNRTTHPTQKLCDVPNTSAETKVSKTKQIARTSYVSNRTTETIKANTVTDLMKQTKITPEIDRNESKIYKCSECDVHFLTAESCYDHTNNHTPLDPTEYIGCKMCDLQFLCEFLGKHMKNHREKLFDVDKLVVDEYYPNGRIETYSAKDRITWKLVSTTTHPDLK